jgi:hypothetical protein
LPNLKSPIDIKTKGSPPKSSKTAIIKEELSKKLDYGSEEDEDENDEDDSDYDEEDPTRSSAKNFKPKSIFYENKFLFRDCQVCKRCIK